MHCVGGKVVFLFTQEMEGCGFLQLIETPDLIGEGILKIMTTDIKEINLEKL